MGNAFEDASVNTGASRAQIAELVAEFDSSGMTREAVVVASMKLQVLSTVIMLDLLDEARRSNKLLDEIYAAVEGR